MARQLKNLLVYHLHDKMLRQLANRYVTGRLIDIGCGEKPYQNLVAPLVTEHIGLDLPSGIHGGTSVDLIGSAYKIPSVDSEFDSALCTAVLEHLEEPEQALLECFRVLKPEGNAIYSVPFIWHLHEEPRDFYRFSKYGLEYLFEKTGFEVIEIQALSGFWVTFGQLLIYNLYRLNRGPLRWLHIIDLIGLPFQAFFYLLDKIDRTEQWTWMYMLVARKPRS